MVFFNTFLIRIQCIPFWGESGTFASLFDSWSAKVRVDPELSHELISWVWFLLERSCRVLAVSDRSFELLDTEGEEDVRTEDIGREGDFRGDGIGGVLLAEIERWIESEESLRTMELSDFDCLKFIRSFGWSNKAELCTIIESLELGFLRCVEDAVLDALVLPCASLKRYCVKKLPSMKIIFNRKKIRTSSSNSSWARVLFYPIKQQNKV